MKTVDCDADALSVDSDVSEDTQKFIDEINWDGNIDPDYAG